MRPPGGHGNDRAGAARAGRVRLEGVRKQALDTVRNRLLVTAVVMTLMYLVVAGRLFELTVLEGTGEPRLGASTRSLASSASTPVPSAGRADVVDRNGVILATSLPTASLYADPREVLDAEVAAGALVRVLPGLDRESTLAKLNAKSGFVWLRRNLTPNQQYAVNSLGLPGLTFQRAQRRAYPLGREAAHILGATDVDGRGIAGIEKRFDRELRGAPEALELSVDIRVQAIVRMELAAAVAEFQALGGVGIVLDADTAEVLAMVSLPDYDPNLSAGARGDAAFNRATKGVYELGSVLKLVTIASALDSGTVTFSDGYDASRPIRIARFTITDFHPQNRWLSVPEILVHSSNIGAARMALDMGGKTQRLYLGRLGLLRRSEVELPEVATPLTPEPWRDINTMTIAFGHGIAITPLHLAGAVAALVNGGLMRQPTLLKRSPDHPRPGERVVTETTSRQMRALMRLVVREGTGANADVPGYLVGGKTGTAEKQGAGGYRRKALISSFIGVFPSDAPRYVILVLVDEPQGNESTYGYATGGWVAAPVVGRLVRRIAPLLGVAPRPGEEERPAPGHPLFIPIGGEPATRRERHVAVN